MAKIYFRMLDTTDGLVAIKMVADPKRSEWEEDDLTPAQVLALLAYGEMLRHSDRRDETEVDPVEPELIGIAPAKISGGN